MVLLIIIGETYMKIDNSIKSILLENAQNNRRRCGSRFINEEEKEYILDYLKNEKDIKPLESFNKDKAELSKLFQQTLEEANDKQSVLDALEVKTNNHDDPAMLALGLIYMFGRCVEKDYKKGIDYIVRAAINENPIAQRYLAKCHYNGSFGSFSTSKEDDEFEQAIGHNIQSRELAYFWDFKSAMNGYPDAQYIFVENHLYRSYDIGGFSDELFELLEISANQGHSQAREMLIGILLNEKSGYQNFNKATKLAQQYSLEDQRLAITLRNMFKKRGLNLQF